MTTKELLIENLSSFGMFKQQAEEVANLAIPEINKHVADYTVTWDSDSAGYPKRLHDLFLRLTKPFALKWIEENKPNAWFKSMFE